MAEYSMAIVLGADGTAMIGTFDNATNSMVKLQNASEVLQEQLGDTGKAGKTAAEGIKESGNQADAARKKFADAGEAIEKKFAFGVKAGVAGVAALIGVSINAADRAGKLSQQLGVSTEFISGMGFVADQTGSNLNVLSSGLGELGNNAAKAAGGNKQSAATFAALGVSVVDAHGRLRGLEQLLPELADRFAGMQDGIGKAALANRVFGSSGNELIPMLNRGAQGMAEMQRQAAELGQVISGDTAASANELGDNIDLVKASFMGMANTIAAQLLPYLVAISGHTDTIVNTITLLGVVATTVYAGKLVKIALDYGSALADLVFKNRAVAVAEAERGAASAAASGLSFKSLGLLQSGFLLLQAAVVGWSIGTYLREEFVEARLFGIAFIEGILTGWERIKQFGSIAWEGVKAAFVGSINIMRALLADFIGAYAGAMALIPEKLGGGKITAALRGWETALRPATSAADELSAAVARINAEAETSIASVKDITGGLAEYEIAADLASKGTKSAAAAVGAATPPVVRFSAATGVATDKVRDYAEALEDMAYEILVNRDARELMLLKMAIEEAQTKHNTELVELLTRAYDMRALAIEDTGEALTTYADIVAGVNDSYDEEIRLLGLSNEQRQVEEELLRLVGDAKRDGLDLDDDQQSSLRGLIATRQQHMQSLRDERQLIENNQGIIRSGFYELTDLATDWANGTIGSFKDVAREGLDIIKKMVIDMLANIFKMRVVEPFLRGLFSGGGTGGGWGNVIGSLLGGGTGGGGNVMGSLLSAATGSGGGNPWLSVVSGAASSGGGNGGVLGGLLGMFGGGGYGSIAATPINSVGPLAGGYAYPASGGAGPALGPWGTALAGVGGALYGYNQTNGGAAGVGAGLAYGAAGIGIAGTAAGLAGGATLGAAAGGAFGAFGAAAAIPVVGWILAALAFIDIAAGGKLFGTKFHPKASTQTLSIGAEGGDATASLLKERERALFGGTAYATDTLNPGREAEDAADSLFKASHDAMVAIAQALGTDIPDVIDASIRTVIEYTKKGKEKSRKIFVDVLGRTYEEADGEAAATRVMAESWIAAMDAAAAQIAGTAVPLIDDETIRRVLGVGRTRDPNMLMATDDDGIEYASSRASIVNANSTEIQRLANRWRSDAEQLMEGARFLFAAMEANKRGLGLLGESGTLTQITDLTEDLQRGEETLSETFARILGNTEQFRSVLEQMGRTIDISAVAFVDLATDIADAAGGLDQARSMWVAYFEAFYTAAERAQFQQSSVLTAAATQGAALGLDPNISLAQFRDAFEAALPSLTGSEIVAWQQFAQVLVQVAAARDAVIQAERTHVQWVAQLSAESTGFVESGYQQALRAIRDATAQHIANADALAQAQGRTGASTADLALIFNWTARQMALAQQALEQVAMDLASQLGYGPLQTIEEQIARLESGGASAQSSIDGATAASVDFFQQFEDGLRSLSDYFDSLLLGDLSPLSPEDQIAEARRQLEENAAAVRNGDVGALSQSQGLLETFLRLMRGHEASGDDYTQEFNWARGLYDGIANPYSGAGGGLPGTVSLVPSPELQALYLQRDQLMAQQDAAQRAAIAADLAARISEIISTSGETLTAVATRIGVPLDRMVFDLTGINLGIDTLTAATVQQLGGVANQVGIELGDLATALGIELGVLTDRNSLFNDALELAIASLPEEFRSQLEPALRDVENASSPDQQVDAIENLERITGTLPEQFRLQLAPYLSAIDPLDPSLFTDLDYLSSLDENMARATGLLAQILDQFLGGGSFGDPVPPPIDPTLVANGGQALAYSPALTAFGSGGPSQEAMLIEMQQLRGEVVRLGDRLERSLDHNREAVKEGATHVAQQGESAMRKLGDDIRSNARSAA